MSRPPNVLLLLTDEERAPTCYEDEALTRFRREHMPTRAALRARGFAFDSHYVASTACAPSRASLLTGHYPSLHGVSQTDGIGKRASDTEMHWLDPDTVPTMGDYFRAGGYDARYIGKWHVSHADLPVPGEHRSLAITRADGTLLPAHVAAYRNANRLAGFGFDGWTGPDPHGPEHCNSGIVRDPHYADEALACLDALEARDPGTEKPFLLVCSFVNPHDIVFFGAPWLLRAGMPHAGPEVPHIPPPPTAREDLRDKPAAQRAYARGYTRMFIPQPAIALYRRFYFALHAEVDRALGRVMQRLAASRFADDTIVVLTSDHGDMLGAHGGMKQKWHNAYEETIHVPCLFSLPPRLARSGTSTRCAAPTSHVDLLPTLLGLAGIDETSARNSLAATHTEAQPLVGRDLSAVVRGDAGAPSDPVYFVTRDDVSAGAVRRNRLGLPLPTIPQPNQVEAIVAQLDTPSGTRRLKYTRYFQAEEHADPYADDPPRRTRAQEHELYDLDADPLEQTNLAHPRHRTSHSAALCARMDKLLAASRAKQQVHPQTAAVPQEAMPLGLSVLRRVTRRLPVLR